MYWLKQKHDSSYGWAEAHSEYKVWMARSTHVHQQNWTEGVGSSFCPAGFISAYANWLSEAFSCSLTLDFFLCDFFTLCPSCSTCSIVHLTLHPEQCSKMICSWHAGKWLAEVTNNDCQPVVNVSQMSGYCFSVAPSLKHQGKNDFSPTLWGHIGMPKGITQM